MEGTESVLETQHRIEQAIGKAERDGIHHQVPAARPGRPQAIGQRHTGRRRIDSNDRSGDLTKTFGDAPISAAKLQDRVRGLDLFLGMLDFRFEVLLHPRRCHLVAVLQPASGQLVTVVAHRVGVFSYPSVRRAQ